MPFLVDGHNLIGKTPGLSLGDVDDEEQLLALLDVTCRRLRKKAIVFFDPGPHSGQSRLGSSWVEVRFARGSADEAVIDYLQRQKDRGSYTVITSDQKVAGQAKRLRAVVQSSESFAAELRASSPPSKEAGETPPSPEEVQELLRLFEARKTVKKRKTN